MENTTFEKRNKQFQSEIRRELAEKKKKGIELTQTEGKILEQFMSFYAEESFWEKNRNL